MIIVANTNPIHQWIEEKCNREMGAYIISEKEALAMDVLERISPEYIFFLHWSYIIPKEIHERFNCVVFHMTDLPFGRGGSPLQNLILRGYQKTMISAIKVSNGIDTGDIYLKKELSLLGTAEEIFLRAGQEMYKMIKELSHTRITPIPQEGEGEVFKRRIPVESRISGMQSLEQLFNFIRMLDAEGYPHAFIEIDDFRFEFTRASLKKDAIITDVRIIKK